MADIQEFVVRGQLVVVDLVQEAHAALGQTVGEPVYGLAGVVSPELGKTAAGITLTPVAQVANGRLFVHIVAVGDLLF